VLLRLLQDASLDRERRDDRSQGAQPHGLAHVVLAILKRLSGAVLVSPHVIVSSISIAA